MVALRVEEHSPRLVIATDSLSSIYLIRKGLVYPHRIRHHKHGPMLADICTTLAERDRAGFTTTVLKVRAHTNIEGNEPADVAAKAASSGEDDDRNGNYIPTEYMPETHESDFRIAGGPRNPLSPGRGGH